MTNMEHTTMLDQGVDAWNAWRDENPDVRPELDELALHDRYLSGINLNGANLRGLSAQRINLSNALLRGADLRGADLTRGDLSGANFRGANLSGDTTTLIDVVCNRTCFAEANLSRARLSNSHISQGSDFIDANLSDADMDDVYLGGSVLPGANLSGARLNNARLDDAFGPVDLTYADMTGVDAHSAVFTGANCSHAVLRSAYLGAVNFTRADLLGADLTGANLSGAQFIETNIEAARLSGCRVYGVAAWRLRGSPADQSDLIITPEDEATAIVGDLEVAQFIYMLLSRSKLRNVIDAVTQRGVLLLGRFGDGGLVVLQAIAEWLSKSENGGYLPLLFDFPRPENKTYTETVRTLAGLARFAIVDLSGPSVPQEITATVDLYAIPFVPILAQEHEEWSMFRDFLLKERVVSPPVRFANNDELLKRLADEVIAPAEKLIEERQKKLDEIFGRA